MMSAGFVDVLSRLEAEIEHYPGIQICSYTRLSRLVLLSEDTRLNLRLARGKIRQIR